MPRPQPTAAKRPPGRPPSDPSGRQTPRQVKLAPDEIDHLKRVYGGINAGVRELVRRDIDAAPK